ncbi:MAG: efflux RND transporter periplasmic adaptor subunit [Rhodospirillales bacterium]|nr:efflux RND transporter periplasmic adaptor subunit [Rhodospirillales bacterium]
MRRFFLVFSLVLAVSGGVWGWVFFQRQGSGDSSVSQSVVEIVPGDIESVVTAQGTLEPKDYVDVGAQVSGLVKKLHVDIGDTVKIGDLIAEIDPDVYESRVRGGQARLKTLQAQKLEQQALIRQATQKLERSRTLVRDKVVSKETFEDAQTALDIAQVRLISLNAQIEEAQSTLEGDKTSLGYTKIYAPMEGTVVSQSTKEGQTINATQTAPVIVQVANLDVMTVRAQVAEADVIKLRPGMSLYFTTLGAGARRWEGKIRQILPSPEKINDVVLYNVLVDVGNADRSLMTGMTTQMFFVLGYVKGVPVIPVSALIRRLPESDTTEGSAWEVEVLEGGKIQTRTVIIGISNRIQAAVLEGLSPGDKVVSGRDFSASGSGRLRRLPPGMARL